MDTSIRIAFLGLGNMGTPLAQLLVQDGFSLTVWNRSREKMAPLAAAGARTAATPSEAAGQADLVITLLGDDHAVESVTLGPDGLLAGLRPGAVHVGMSTVAPGLSSRLARVIGDGLNFAGFLQEASPSPRRCRRCEGVRKAEQLGNRLIPVMHFAASLQYAPHKPA